MDDDLQSAEELTRFRVLTTQLRAENARLLRLLDLTPKQAAPPGPAQTGFFEGHLGPVDRHSAPETKVEFFAALFAARTDIYATRWENTRAGKAGWLPAVRGGWRKGVRHDDRKQIPARRWLGLTATPYRRDKLDDLIALQLGPVRHTITHSTASQPGETPQLDLQQTELRPTPVLHVHDTAYRYLGDAAPSAPGGMAAIYRDLVADHARTTQVVDDVAAALKRGRHCLVLTQWTAHVERFTDELRQRALDPVVLRGGMSAKARRDALTRLHPPADGSPLLFVATGPFVGEGFDCPVLDTLFLAAPIAFKGRLVQYAGRILRVHPGKTTAEVHDYHDVDTGVLASSLAKRAPGYVSLGFTDPRKLRTRA